MSTRFEIEVVASVDVPLTVNAPFEAREEVAISDPTRAAPWRVVEARVDEVVEVSAPKVAEPDVMEEAVIDDVAVIAPPVIEPEVSADDVMEVLAVIEPAVSLPIVALASVAVEVEVIVPEVSEPIVALEAVSDWIMEEMKLEIEAKRLVEEDWVNVAAFA